MEYNKRTIKLEQYKEKLKERELNNDTYFLDKFSNNNNYNNNRLDMTLNPKNNSLINQENQIFNKNDFSRTSRRNATPNINYKNNNNNLDNSNMIYNSNFTNIDNKNIINHTNSSNAINVYNNNSKPNINNYSRSTQSQNKNYNQNRNNIIDYSKDPFGNSYRGAGIIPRDRGATIKEDQLNQNKMLKEIWAKEMEEKKRREEIEKQKQKELDLMEDEKIRRIVEEEKKQLEEEKKIKKQNEKNIVKENEQLIQNKKNILENGGNTNKEVQQNNEVINNNNDLNNFKYNYIRKKYENLDLNKIQFYHKNNNNNINNINEKIYYRNKINQYNLFNNRRVNQFEFSPNPRLLDDSKNPQIAKLKNEINTGYMEISSLFKQLKNNVLEANLNKNKAQNNFKLISDEINKEKMYHLQLEKKKYDQMKQEEMFDYYYANVRDVDPVYHIKNDKDFQKEKSNLSDMSNLARAGQNLIRLKAQSEFIPIGVNTYDSNIRIEDNERINENINDPGNNIALKDDPKNNIEIESETIFQQTGEDNF